MMRRMARLSPVAWCTIAAFAAPILLAWLLSSTAFSSRVVPDYLEQARASDQAVGLIAEVSKLMLTLSGGLSVGSLAIFNRMAAPSVRRPALAMVALAMLAAFVAVYSGLRFLFDLSRQLAFVAFDFDPLRGRLYWQGTAMLLQVSALCALMAQSSAATIEGWWRRSGEDAR